MLTAIYIQSSLVCYDLVAVFNTRYLTAAPSCWPDEVCDWLTSEGEEVFRLPVTDLSQLPICLEVSVVQAVRERKLLPAATPSQPCAPGPTK